MLWRQHCRCQNKVWSLPIGFCATSDQVKKFVAATDFLLQFLKTSYLTKKVPLKAGSSDVSSECSTFSIQSLNSCSKIQCLPWFEEMTWIDQGAILLKKQKTIHPLINCVKESEIGQCREINCGLFSEQSSQKLDQLVIDNLHVCKTMAGWINWWLTFSLFHALLHEILPLVHDMSRQRRGNIAFWSNKCNHRVLFKNNRGLFCEQVTVIRQMNITSAWIFGPIIAAKTLLVLLLCLVICLPHHSWSKEFFLGLAPTGMPPTPCFRDVSKPDMQSSRSDCLLPTQTHDAFVECETGFFGWRLVLEMSVQSADA